MNKDPGEERKLSALQRAFIAVKDIRGRMEALERSRSEPIAIIGLGCRFPGGASDPEAFWRLLEAGKDAIRGIPEDRWDVEAHYDPDPGTPGKMYTREGGFLSEEIDRFDEAFFGISPREAVSMDPQQRLLLEVTWEALEHACIRPATLAGSMTGVYVGMATNDYLQLRLKHLPVSKIDAYAGTGTAPCVAAGRLSYFLGLSGPAMALDTACSSSLVAIDLAVQHLRSGKCSLALAGGVNLMLSPEAAICLSKVRALSPDSRCRSFDANAQGYARGEGCGMVVLKTLSAAQSDGDRILAVIRGSATNHDGRSSGLTVPNGPAQQAVIRQALADARIDPKAVQYVEAHGTGTPLGDPIELRALGAVLREGRDAGDFFYVGSVKSNIGHLEAAAGVAGVIKTVLSMQNRRIPPNLHFKDPNPHIEWDALPLRIPTDCVAWPRRDRPLVAGVSGYGFSGTNAHIILESAPEEPVREAETERPLHILTLSAKKESVLKTLAERHLSRLDADPSLAAGDLCFSANAGRTHFEERLAVIGEASGAFKEPLAAFLEERTSPALFRGRSKPGEAPKVAFLFTGQGSRYVGMGYELYRTEPAFRSALDACDRLLAPHLEPSLLSVLYPPPGKLHAAEALLKRNAYTEPALFSIAYALAKLWISWGIAPSAVMGHSVGEYAAACVAGVFSLEAGIRLVAERGRLMEALPEDGKMTIEPFRRVLGEIDFSPPRMRIVSNLTGRPAAAHELSDPGYWTRHGLSPVRFADSIRSMSELGCTIYLEIGPGPVLTGMARRCLPEGAGLYLPSLRPGQKDWRAMLQSLAALYVRGAEIDWDRYDRDYPRRKTDIPTYPFQGEKYWLEIGGKRSEARLSSAEAEGEVHPLLGARIDSVRLQDTVFSSKMDTGRIPFLKDHRVNGIAVFPATGYLEMGLAAAGIAFGEGRLGIRDLSIEEPLTFREGETRTVQLVHAPVAGGEAGFEIYSLGETGWVRHAAGRMHSVAASSDTMNLSEIRKRLTDRIEVSGFYRDMAKRGIEYGRIFQGIKELRHATGESLGRIENPGGADYRVHPALLDAGLQTVGAAFAERDGDDLYLPLGFESLRVFGEIPPVVWCHAAIRTDRPENRESIRADICLMDEAGRKVLEISGFTVKRAGGEAILRLGEKNFEDRLYRIEWEERPRSAAPDEEKAAGSAWLIFMDGEGIGIETVRRLEAKGERCLGLVPGSGYRKLAPDRYSVDPADPADFERFLREAFLETGIHCRGVVHFWNLDNRIEGADRYWLDAGQIAGCGSLLHWVRAVAANPAIGRPRHWVVTRGAQSVEPFSAANQAGQAPVWGLARVAALEHPDLDVRTVDLDPGAGTELTPLIEELLRPDLEDRIAFRRGGRFVARLARGSGQISEESGKNPIPDAEAFQLAISERGVLENLRFKAISRRSPGPGEIEIRVHATGLNFRDVLGALGMYPGDPGPPGGECAGRIAAVGKGVEGLRVGDPVFGLAGGSFGNYVRTRSDWIVRRPAGLTEAEAAAVPIAFLTARHGLHRLAGMKAGDRVLIHSAAGGVGMAAVQLAKRAGAEIFATAGSPEKRESVRSLGVRHLFSSRKADFREEILRITGGRGVDIVLNSLTGEFITEGLRVLAPGGTFLEIGKAEIYPEEKVAAINPKVHYRPFDLGDVMISRPDLIASMFGELLEGFADGTLRPLPLRVFPIEQSVEAFRFMAQARHTGKLVVSQRHRFDAAFAKRFKPEGVYLVTGGFGGLGLQAARWIVERGGRELALVGRSAPSAQALRTVRELEGRGARVRIFKGDVSEEKDVRRILSDVASGDPPLRGIIHTAGVIEDRMLVEQTWKGFENVFAPKVRGTWFLHDLSRGLDLDCFILFSSTTSVLGAPGQGNYAAANAFLDALVSLRLSMGLPVLSVNWGPWNGEGMAARLGKREKERLSGQGIEMIRPEEGFAILEMLIRRGAAQAVVLPVHWSKLFGADPPGKTPPLLERMAKETGARKRKEKRNEPGADILKRLAEAPESERPDLLLSFVCSRVEKVLGAGSAGVFDIAAPFSSLGFDSLMSVELRNSLAGAFGRPLPTSLVYDHPSIERLSQFLGEEIFGLAGGRIEEEKTSVEEKEWENASEELDVLSQDEMARLLAEKLTELRA